MNQPRWKTGTYALAGVVALVLLIFLSRFAFRETPEPSNQQPARSRTVKPQSQHDTQAFLPTQESQSEANVSFTEDSAVTNAAVLYRQAFGLFDALSKEQKQVLK
jgi:hypothetical protein